jgi:hypothetical protein
VSALAHTLRVARHAAGGGGRGGAGAARAGGAGGGVPRAPPPRPPGAPGGGRGGPPLAGKRGAGSTSPSANPARFTSSSVEAGDSQRLAEAPTRLQEIPVLAVHCRVLHARQQKAVAIPGPVLGVVFEQALGQLLIVRVVADPAGDQSQLLDERLTVGRR